MKYWNISWKIIDVSYVCPFLVQLVQLFDNIDFYYTGVAFQPRVATRKRRSNSHGSPLFQSSSSSFAISLSLFPTSWKSWGMKKTSEKQRYILFHCLNDLFCEYQNIRKKTIGDPRQNLNERDHNKEFSLLNLPFFYLIFKLTIFPRKLKDSFCLKTLVI